MVGYSHPAAFSGNITLAVRSGGSGGNCQRSYHHCPAGNHKLYDAIWKNRTARNLGLVSRILYREIGGGHRGARPLDSSLAEHFVQIAVKTVRSNPAYAVSFVGKARIAPSPCRHYRGFGATDHNADQFALPVRQFDHRRRLLDLSGLFVLARSD